MTPGFPFLTMLDEGAGIGQTVSPSTPKQSNPVLDAIQAAEGAAGAAPDRIMPSVSSFFSSNFFGIQFVTGILGLILIAGGIFLFKPVQNVVVGAAKTAAKGAAL